MSALYAWRSARDLVACARDEAAWRWEIGGRDPGSDVSLKLWIIETPEGRPVGYLGHPRKLWGAEIGAREYELAADVSWAAVSPSAIRFLAAKGGEYAAHTGGRLSGFSLSLGARHPAYEAAAHLLPTYHEPYAWYLRIADLPGFLRRIAPVLEHRLQDSVVSGHSGDVKLNFYRDGVRLVFEEGRLTEVAPWLPAPEDAGSAAFPGLTFLRLLFGYRTLDELRYAWADCGVRDEARPLLAALFPKRGSNVWALL